MECAAYVGITDPDEYDAYVTNHYKFTYPLDDVVSHVWDDEENVAFAIERGRGKALENGHIADLWGIEADPQSGITAERINTNKDCSRL